MRLQVPSLGLTVDLLIPPFITYNPSLRGLGCLSRGRMSEYCAAQAMVVGSIHVSLMSGRAVQVPASTELSLKHVRLYAQSALDTGLLRSNLI